MLPVFSILCCSIGNVFEKKRYKLLKAHKHGFVMPSEQVVHPDYADKVLCDFGLDGFKPVKADSNAYKKFERKQRINREWRAITDFYEKLDAEQPWLFLNIDYMKVEFYLNFSEPGTFLVVKNPYNMYELHWLNRNYQQKRAFVFSKYKKDRNRKCFKIYSQKKWHECIVDLIEDAQENEITGFEVKLKNGFDLTKFYDNQ